jgi:2'-5' RNA ligase
VAPFRWTLPEQGPLTLAFAAAAPERVLDDVEERLATAAARRQPFELRIAGGGAFPHVAGAKVLWAGVQAARDEAPVDARAELDLLASGARAAFAKAGATVDGQRFRPHVTLARLGHPEELTRWVRLLDAYEGPAWHVDTLTLVRSHLGEGPRRTPRSETVGEFPLG